MARKRIPQKAFDEIKAVLKKHGVEGFGVALTAKSGTKSTAADLACPPGQTPTWVEYELPDGTRVRKLVCM